MNDFFKFDDKRIVSIILMIINLILIMIVMKAMMTVI